MRGPVPSKVGQLVRCLRTAGYNHAEGTGGYNFTEGREYRVLGYTPTTQTLGAAGRFVFPALISVIDDFGRTAECHASRFEVVEVIRPSEVGQRMRCTNPSSYALTKGKEYTVTRFEHGGVVGAHTFPDYVGFIDDNGDSSMSHTYRFEVIP